LYGCASVLNPILQVLPNSWMTIRHGMKSVALHEYHKQIRARCPLHGIMYALYPKCPVLLGSLMTSCDGVKSAAPAQQLYTNKNAVILASMWQHNIFKISRLS